MPELAFAVDDWFPAAHGSPELQQTTGSLRIQASVGDTQVIATEVEDRLAKMVRPRIHVPLLHLAEWLLMNWWRLRWESRSAGRSPPSDWRAAHCLSAIGGGVPWPPLEISSDGEFVRLTMEAESVADAATIRYLRTVDVDVPAAIFEAAVDRFIETVDGRLRPARPEYEELAELRKELSEERRSPSLTRSCRWQALAGLDPGSADETWFARIQELLDELGHAAGEEVLGMAGDKQAGRCTRSAPIGTSLGTRSPPCTSLPEDAWSRSRSLVERVAERSLASAGAT